MMPYEDLRSCLSRISELESENEALKREIGELNATILSLNETIKELTCRTGMNSSNSSKPPSSDGYHRPNPRPLKGKSGKSKGAQPGHKGCHLDIPHDPDEVVDHLPEKCMSCPRRAECSSGQVFSCEDTRYVIDVEVKTTVTAHRLMRADCPMGCSDGKEPVTGSFPDWIKAHVQYGDVITAIVGLLDTYGAMSDIRNSGFVKSVFGLTLSPGTVVNMTRRCADLVKPVTRIIAEKICQSEVAHFDESGADTDGRILWVHNSSTSEYTYQTISEKRGIDGIEENGVFPRFMGRAIHDCWLAYFRYRRMKHGVCCAHILRELRGIEEMEPDHTWPAKFRNLLLAMKSAKESAQAVGIDRLCDPMLDSFDERYDRIIALAETECPPPPQPAVKKPGRRKKGKERALIERLRDLKDAVCLYVRDFIVPFDNNQAERDLRNIKSKVKIGCFRSKDCAQDYLSIMSYLSTGRKHGVGAYAAMLSAIRGNGQIVLHHRSA